jgi:hypothetical protein
VGPRTYFHCTKEVEATTLPTRSPGYLAALNATRDHVRNLPPLLSGRSNIP